ncbi:hypothetical protein P756_gp97 [Mycobacterium phage PhrostyMug]|uniref:hypothetical protein n=1 Tax=Mycobacterium phage PhrostyMug TaxID=1354512 RepID=UPI0003926F16|nr:hypothetical protein P756_gp97 [Mycobacterium phage PhrostyMug]AGU92305.1 hypothetical protein PHROSTYMUG_97 [Mycobacterium phage PhrostyMug]
MPIAGPSQPRRATSTCLSIDRTRRPVSSRQRTNHHPLEPRDRPRTPGPSKADPRHHPPRDRTPKARSIRRTRPRSIDPIDVERELRSRNVGSISKLSHPLDAEPRRSRARIRIRSRVGIELGASSVPRACRIGHRAGRVCCGAAGGAGYRGQAGQGRGVGAQGVRVPGRGG